MNDTRIYQIKEKLIKLSAADIEHKIFGATEYAKIDHGHHYKLLPTVTQYEIEQFESKRQVSLPDEYKTFLTCMSGGGAGPYYGLYTMEKGVKEAQEYSTEDSKGIENPLSIDFPFSNSETQKFINYYNACIEEGDDDEIVYPEIPDELTGVIFLSEYGCGWSYLLVVKGEQAGTVWFHGEYMCPVFFKGKQCGFFDWYEQWLDNSLKELGHSTAKAEP